MLYNFGASRNSLNRVQHLKCDVRAASHRYARRGFRVAVPGFPGRCSIDSSIYLQPFKELQVSVSLLVAELHSEQQTSHSVLYVYVASFQ